KQPLTTVVEAVDQVCIARAASGTEGDLARPLSGLGHERTDQRRIGHVRPKATETRPAEWAASGPTAAGFPPYSPLRAFRSPRSAAPVGGPPRAAARRQLYSIGGFWINVLLVRLGLGRSVVRHR